MAAPLERFIGPGGQEFVTSMFTSTSPKGTWATIIELQTTMPRI
jgi:hypothetical protein